MCGITGIFAFNEVGNFYLINLAKATDVLSRRGPDARGNFVTDFIGLGHRRLSVIDTSSRANQPMHDITNRYVIVFNGEIFNYKELKKNLVARGEIFQTDSDTEVLLTLYRLEGKDFLQKLIGFFAFAIYDKEDQSLFIARDRIGIKPLLYYADEDKFIFASEMKSILAYNVPRELNPSSALMAMQISYTPGSETIFKNIYRLLPGHYMIVKKKQLNIQSYYSLPYTTGCTTLNNHTYEMQQNTLLELLEDSVKLRLVSDVPLGAFLSGGTDSSAIVSLASRHVKELHTFSIGYKDDPFFDETQYAELVAKKFNTIHTSFSLSLTDLSENVFDMLNYLDEPFADSSCLPLYILSKHTSKHIKVVLSGDGADEIFAGYNKYYGEMQIRSNDWRIRLIKAIAPLLHLMPKNRHSYFGNLIRQLHKVAEAANMNCEQRYFYLSSFNTENVLKNYLTQAWIKNLSEPDYILSKKQIGSLLSETDGINSVLYADTKYVLPGDMLYKADMMSMANGLELRVPFLDHRVVNFAFSLPSESKIMGKMKKRILKDTFRNLLPPELYNRPKKGFDVPLMKLFATTLRKDVEELFSKDFLKEQNIFRYEAVSPLCNEVFKQSSHIDQEAFWCFFVFQYWWRKYMIS
ncbi:MAG: asparagine synthase (glutamine-hydrolyzing) [Cytophagaceae bacterium]|nr:asparagine synthase (glutamine-hydrolyzing) [Cytophagaceae bacterium]MDW8455916.1 asparagine synthase (glutamine-hydrolyzing) [Cytophagaceae bacterium]